MALNSVLVFWLLMVSSFNYLKMHACLQACLFKYGLLLLHSAFKRGLSTHGNYIVDHGKSWKNHGIVFLNFCWNPGLLLNAGQKYCRMLHLQYF